MKSKYWMSVTDNVARCSRCGGVSQWVPGLMISGLYREKQLDYWTWWKRFKQRHAKCLKMQS